MFNKLLERGELRYVLVIKGRIITCNKEVH